MSTRKLDYPKESDFNKAAIILNCDVEAIKAVAKVESGSNGAFLESGEPVILFEPHVFHRLTDGKYAGKKIPNVNEKWSYISYPRWRPGWYGPVSVQHQRLQFACTLDRDKACQSASWGLFQIMGYHYLRCGHLTLQSFINAMFKNVSEHLFAFCQFIKVSDRLSKSLRDHDWKTFKTIYNGPGGNDYVSKIDMEYKRLIGWG